MVARVKGAEVDSSGELGCGARLGGWLQSNVLCASRMPCVVRLGKHPLSRTSRARALALAQRDGSAGFGAEIPRP